MNANAQPPSRSRTRVATLTAFAAIVAVIIAAVYFWQTKTPSWTAVNGYIAARYADIDSISTDQLAALLSLTASPSQKPLVLDIREAEEYAVSRIPGARHVAPSSVFEVAEREFDSFARTQPMVVYCSVGARSAQAAQDLKALGFTHVKNLSGSIFQWANEGRPLEGGTLVHPYDSQWGQLLRRELHSMTTTTTKH